MSACWAMCSISSDLFTKGPLSNVFHDNQRCRQSGRLADVARARFITAASPIRCQARMRILCRFDHPDFEGCDLQLQLRGRPLAFTTALLRSPARSPRPGSRVSAVPPRSGVRGASSPGREHALDRADDRVVRLAVAEEVEHHRARPDLPDRVGDAPAGDVGRRAVHRLEQRRMTARRVRGWPMARCRSCRCRPGPRSLRMSPNRLLATTTSNASGRCTKCAVRMSMWKRSTATSG